MSVAKAKLIDSNGKTLEVQFNPETLSIQHQTTGEAGRTQPGVPADSSGKPTAGKASNRTSYSTSLSQVTLLFDTSDSGENVRNKTLIIAKMMEPENNTSPVVTFQWGSLIFKVHITGMTEELTYFSEQGVPLRAKLSLQMTTVGEERAANSVAGQNSGLGLSASASLGASIGASAGVSAGASIGASVSTGLSAGASIGTTPLSSSQGGQSLQSLAGQCRNQLEGGG